MAFIVYCLIGNKILYIIIMYYQYTRDSVVLRVVNKKKCAALSGSASQDFVEEGF